MLRHSPLACMGQLTLGRECCWGCCRVLDSSSLEVCFRVPFKSALQSRLKCYAIMSPSRRHYQLFIQPLNDGVHMLTAALWKEYVWLEESNCLGLHHVISSTSLSTLRHDGGVRPGHEVPSLASSGSWSSSEFTGMLQLGHIASVEKATSLGCLCLFSFFIWLQLVVVTNNLVYSLSFHSHWTHGLYQQCSQFQFF